MSNFIICAVTALIIIYLVNSLNGGSNGCCSTEVKYGKK